jgi:sec-independent protein translocase protein TatA
VVLAVVLLLFGGGGKISRLMGDFGRGLKSFKKGLAENEEEQAAVDEADTKALSSEAANTDQAAPQRKKAAKS